jgi:hypothetical protein
LYAIAIAIQPIPFDRIYERLRRDLGKGMLFRDIDSIPARNRFSKLHRRSASGNAVLFSL